MCLTTSTPAASSGTAVNPKAFKRSASDFKQSTSHFKRSTSDTCLMAHADFDDMEDYDAFYVPGDDDDTTLGDTIDVDEWSSQHDSVKVGESVDVDSLCVVDLVPSPPTPLSKKDRNVSFGSLSELSFPVIQGHRNSAISHPLMLGWELMDQSVQSIDDYEEEREREGRRSYEELHIDSKEERKQIIADSKKAYKEFAKRQQQERRERRGGVARRNSMANGMMFGKDPRRNRVQEFVGRIKAGMK